MNGIGSITCRCYAGKAGDYHVISSWLERRGQGPLQETLLPATGIIVEFDGALAAVGWMYCDTSIGVAWFHQFVTDPGLGFARGRFALRVLEQALIRCARSNGYSILMAHAVPTLAKKYIENGWTQVGLPSIPLMRRID
jgi:hypothetical protein